MDIVEYHGNSVTLRLSDDERDLFVHHVLMLDPKAVNRLRFGRREGKLLAFNLSTDEFDGVLTALEDAADHIADRSARKGLRTLFDKVGAQLFKLTVALADPETGPFRKMPPEYRDEIHRIIGSGSFESMDEINDAMHEVSTAFNHSPRDEFIGLSPYHVSKILYTAWNGPDAALRLADDLPYADLRDVPIFANAHIVLRALAERKSVKATGAGNLNRKFVEEMLGAMQLPKGYVDMKRQYWKAINEDDVRPLHVLRIVLANAGLLRRAKGVFTVTRKGVGALAEAEAGRLYAQLFFNYFRKFNLAYLDYLPECPGIQDTVAYSFYTIHKLADEWTTMKSLKTKVLLPAVLETVPPCSFGGDNVGPLAETRIIRPLLDFGLVECRAAGPASQPYFDIKQVRKTPLFDRFLTFDLS